jgi:hypothetical protein
LDRILSASALPATSPLPLTLISLVGNPQPTIGEKAMPVRK